MGENYQAYRLPELWKMVADEDPEAGFTHVNALNRLRVALEHQRDNLRVQRDRLAEGWSPDRSEAAAAFIRQLNAMIDAMTFSAAAAARVCTGVDEVYAVLREARRQLEPVLAQYSKRAEGQGLVNPSQGNRALDQRGRDILVAADARVAAAAPLIAAAVPRYQRMRGSEEDLTATDPAGAGTSSGSSGSGGARTSSVLPSPVFDPPPGTNLVGDDSGGGLGGGPRDGHDGLVLTGSSPGPPGPGGDPGGNLGGDAGGPYGSGPVRTAPGQNSLAYPGVVGPGGVIDRPLPTGSVGGRSGQIGGAPVIGGTPARTGVAHPARRQPVVRPATSAEPVEARGTGAPGGYRDHTFEAYAQRRRSKRGNDDELWSVEEGVSPVLEATTEPDRHSPGPGVLGIDR
ncbi:hypothetical protein [Dactylosporangium salmoneum]|uniref:PPE family protein n=1 Tax=Dactylosporangium salmoneum TaxID=53361 RepID=A0ABP5TL91_9ACTN